MPVGQPLEYLHGSQPLILLHLCAIRAPNPHDQPVVVNLHETPADLLQAHHHHHLPPLLLLAWLLPIKKLPSY